MTNPSSAETTQPASDIYAQASAAFDRLHANRNVILNFPDFVAKLVGDATRDYHPDDAEMRRWEIFKTDEATHSIGLRPEPIFLTHQLAGVNSIVPVLIRRDTTHRGETVRLRLRMGHGDAFVWSHDSENDLFFAQEGLRRPLHDLLDILMIEAGDTYAIPAVDVESAAEQRYGSFHDAQEAAGKPIEIPVTAPPSDSQIVLEHFEAEGMNVAALTLDKEGAQALLEALPQLKPAIE